MVGRTVGREDFGGDFVFAVGIEVVPRELKASVGRGVGAREGCALGCKGEHEGNTEWILLTGGRLDEGGKEVGKTVGRYPLLTVNGSPSSSTPIVAISRDFDLGEFGAMVDGIMVLVELLFGTGDVGKKVVVLLGVPPDGIVDF